MIFAGAALILTAALLWHSAVKPVPAPVTEKRK